MSFSSDIKKELCDVRELSPQQAEAMLYGIMYASRMDEGRPLIQTENIDLMNAAAELIRAVFPNVRTGIVRLVKNSGSLYTLKIRSGWEDIAERFGDFSSISREAVSGGDEESGAFLRGVFVSCGSVTDPNKEYHLELVLPENDRTPALLDFIAEHGMSLKETARGGARSKKTVLYAKESELIEDCLTYIGAANHSMEIMQVKIVKDFRNRVNRSVNCENANLDKTVGVQQEHRGYRVHIQHHGRGLAFPRPAGDRAAARGESGDVPVGAVRNIPREDKPQRAESPVKKAVEARRGAEKLQTGMTAAAFRYA